ncbi:MAG: class I adenylate-forming enzyme family protein [Umezawaea sp.]
MTALVVPDLLRLRAAEDPDQVMMNINGEGTMTYAGWERRSNALARGLRRQGVRRGDVVALLFGGLDWVDYATAYLGLLKAGGTAMHLNDTMPPEEVRRRLDQCRPSGFICGSNLVPPVDFAGWSAVAAELDTGSGDPFELEIDPTDISDLLYSSGTTGNSKAVQVPHGNLTFGKGPEGFRQLGDPRPLITPMQLGTTASVTTTNVALTLKATLVVVPPGDVERMAELIDQLSAGSVMVNTMIATRMVAARIHERHDLSSVHTLGAAAAPIAPALAERLLAMFPSARLNSSYTEIEAVPGVVVSTYDPAKKLSVGKPSPSTQLRIAGADGEQVPDGELGEIQLRCDAPRRRYLGNDEPDEWTRTGDLGRIGPDGELYLFDRRADAIETEDGLVSTIEVEAAVYEHPAVLQAAVFGLPGADGRQVIVAAVVLATPDALAELRAFVCARLEPHQIPARFVLMDDLPFSPNGKVRKRVLRERLPATTSA